MKTFDLKTFKRQDTGKKATKLLRTQNQVPCVVYGGEETIHFYAEEKEFRHLIYTPNVYIVNLNIDDQEFKAVLKDIQFHPVSDKILHIDFLEVLETKPVEIGVPVSVKGFAEGVQAGGKLKIEMRRLKTKGLYSDLPDQLTIDVTKIALGESIKVRDLDFDNLELTDPKNAVVISVKLTRVAKGMAAAEDEEVEGEGEGEEGEGEGTDTPEATEE